MSYDHFLNREFGVLQFNERVLKLAMNPRVPLLEKVNFLNIFHSNMDEFFMKRVGGLKAQHQVKIQTFSHDGLSAKEQIKSIYKKNNELNKVVHDFVDKTLKKELEQNQIYLLRWRNLTSKEKNWATEFFRNKIFPVLTPMAVDQGHPFPHISNLSTSIAVSLKHPNESELLFARIKIPPVFPMWIRIDNSEDPKVYRFISTIDLIIQNLPDLFPSMEIESMMTFRITRNIDIKASKDEDAEDLLELITEELKQRRFQEIVRLEHGNNPDPWLLNFLLDELDLKQEDVVVYPGRLEFKDLKQIYKIINPELRYPAFTPIAPSVLSDPNINIFNVIKNGDILVHHPYESFSNSVERFISTAANDPNVVAIKMTFYRTTEDSSIVRSLIRAAEMGKQVVCLIELKARMDEERNIHLAQVLEDAGVHVVYGIVGLKTHAKVVLVVRREHEDFKSYAHIGTGNYNPMTAKLYTDMGLLTCDSVITRDLTELFHYLTGRSLKSNYDKILVAPVSLKDKFLSLIKNEKENAEKGLPSRIIAKMNSLEDKDIIRALYEASQSGVKISLIVRGFCCLKPQVQGLSDNIQVLSVLGRFLEHTRAFYFQNGSEDIAKSLFYIGSADWMSRNLNNRVEVVVPIEDKNLKTKIYEVFEIILQDQVSAWILNSDGTYTQANSSSLTEGSQELILKQIQLKHQLYLQNRLGTNFQ